MPRYSVLKAVVLLLSCSLLLSSTFVGRVLPNPDTYLYVYPNELHVKVCTEFTVEVRVSDVTDLFAWEFLMSFDPVLMQCEGLLEGPFLKQSGPTFFYQVIDNNTGVVHALCVLLMSPVGVNGSGTLVYITFHCTATGASSLYLYQTRLMDSYGHDIPHYVVSGWLVQMTDQMSWKGSFKDYAQSGVPDFDQRQWQNPGTGQWSWCGPTAVANSLWWMDSRFETSQTPPPTINDTFPLVKSYSPSLWDDHDPRNVDPFIRNLAFLMDTDGQRTGLLHKGTSVMDMQAGIAQYLSLTGLNPQGDANGDGVVDDADLDIIRDAYGLEAPYPPPTYPTDAKWNMAADLDQNNVIDIRDVVIAVANYQRPIGNFYEKTVKAPSFEFVKHEVEKCEDVILLLGFWQWNGSSWIRVGGHYTTVAGINSTTIALSDPIQDTAEQMNLDALYTPVPHPYPHATTIHNDTIFVSHDPWTIGPSPSPGGSWGPQGYGVLGGPNFGIFQSQNVPKEFESQTGRFIPTLVYTEVEYVVVVSPTEWYFKPGYVDYAMSGVPDFDMKQDNWIHPLDGYTWCGPVSTANSLWWLDSEYETRNSTFFPNHPPAIENNYNLVTAYGPWDDHDPRNVEPLVNNLAFLMDTDGQRTGLVHSGTFFNDVQVGISQYLQQQGVNPRGDCDGDGDVDANDLKAINDAFGSTPGSPKWNMAADLNHNNVVDMFDAAIAAPNYGKFGLFYEHTEGFPTFEYIEDELYACEDVVLLVEFWRTGETPRDWIFWSNEPGGDGGHYVTVAGVNSTTSEVVISDPWQDAYEFLYKGRSPVDHPYPHSVDKHNDTLYVSHDAYQAALWMGTWSPYGSGIPVWELPGYPQTMGFGLSWHAFLRAAVVTSPHAIAVGRVTTSKDSCTPVPTVGQGYTTEINVTLKNQELHGSSLSTEVYVYANSTIVNSTIRQIPTYEITLTFVCNTSSWAWGNYIISAKTSTSYNTFTSQYVIRVVIPGDIDGDGFVNIFDAVRLSGAAGSDPTKPNWNPNADLNDDKIVNIFDAVILSGHAGQHE